MLSGSVIFASAFAYLLLLFAVASYGDRRARRNSAALKGRPLVYALSLAIYCTSWTYFGGIGLAAERGLEFTGIYIGPILMFTLGMPLIRKIIRLAKTEKLTSVADFIAARYGKNPAVAAIVALISLVGAIPYIALQLKAISSSVAAMINTSDYGIGKGQSFIDLPLLVTLFLACFAIVFGTRHTDATEHQDGLILAIAMESLVKLVALVTAGFYIVFVVFNGPAHLWSLAQQSPAVQSALSYETPTARWVLLIVTSAFAIIMLPRQFHVTVVENRTEGELRTAGILFPLYLIGINLFVLPIAIAGILTFSGTGDADLYLLTLPLANDLPVLTLITFIGGFSAATAMVIVASVALSIMISNDIVMPVFLRRNLSQRGGLQENLAGTLLNIRRSAIFVVLLLGYGYYRSADISAGLASLGLLSFVAISQMAPALLGGLVWRQANARGAITGMVSGFLVWAYLLFLPSLGGPDNSHVATTVLSFLLPFTDLFSGPNADPLVNATALSLLVNCTSYVLASLTRTPKPIERFQAGVFITRRSRTEGAFRGRKTKVTVRDLKATIARYMGAERMQRSFHTYERQTGRWLDDNAPADMAVVHFSEQLLGSAIGSSSARLVLSLALQRGDDTSSETAWLLDQASEALQYNQDMLNTALAQMDQGIAVFDNANNLIIWNRRFRQLLDLPEAAGQVGFPLADIVAVLSKRGDIRKDEEKGLIANFLTLDKPFLLELGNGERIIEVRTNAMPDKGIVTTYTDITQRVAADMALKQANETLELRVAERTGELTRVNHELAEARAAAEEANIGKTRFFAAAGHDILQPLNAARLYSSSLVERLGDSDNSTLVENIDSSLESVEAILGAVLDISRLDTGAMKARVQSVPLNDLLRRIETDFAPMARAKDLELVVMPTSLVVRSDPNLLRRVVQNLVSNAIKYTLTGKVLVGVRRRGAMATIEVLDSGIGIPSSKFRTVFKEFARLDEGARTASGLGLGLSIVDRISRVLNHPVGLQSTPGKGTGFKVTLPLDANAGERVAVRPVAPSKASEALNGLRVLCIDNEPRILEGMRVLLSGWGCIVSTVESISACAEIEGQPSERPHAIIADYHLDDGSGIEAIAKLRAHFGEAIPALLVTADRSPEVRAAAERDGVAVQNKPVRPAAMRAWLTQLSTTARAAAE
ncbi:MULTISPECIES: PAS domain-containing hybrid sensor histidine kinase/response regulator [unclassified Ensifer]|uniref:PAS domain-containing hybrid sensor histidine kinase/response regulator n=1 Tax=unclassified Ensifer TaxID=2633371 RepID=UPI0008138EDC|nr:MULTISPECIES: PAS domain-containing hybrid sensor histidine kinase/response regulator [unclassified Ensifer]OCP05066.1 hybrid sensor histidine kinase/response regulator [Ensifer sp. LC14]OCP11775.1 hybrid sensor histidine kinase/response regulator [Ensifer sp. LC13]OCP12333.1 hybrid sensor histidine kinase/response regulator [Ensifer sp. LC11]OCP33701.1 hybrid sensor histidine kinase/response regulator [Ensifer sp. LC499]